MNERQLFFRVEQRLIEFGYSKDSIQFEFKTPLGRRADIVIFENDKPKIVVEIKGENALLPEKDTELKYHPATRQAQSYAKELHAPFFVVTNGADFRWFTADEDGRPKLLQYPILPQMHVSQGAELGKNKILQILYSLADQSRDYLSFDSLFTNLGVAFLYYFENKEHFVISDFDKYFNFLEGAKLDKDFITQAYSTLYQADLKSYSRILVVQAIDEFLQIYVTDIRLAQFKLPNWLTSFMVDLSSIENSIGFLDIYSNFGDGTVSVNQKIQDVPIYSFSFTSFAYLWDRVKRTILGLNNKNLWLVSPKTMSNVSLPSPVDRILVAPPFGGRFESENRQIQSSEVFFIEESLYLMGKTGFIVTIVPESFLFSASQEKFRSYLLERCRLCTIISLEQFLPKTGIKANILILEKQEERAFGNVLMSELTSSDVKEISSNNQSSRLKEILDLHYRHLSGQILAKSEKIALVPEVDLLNSKSWTVKRFLIKETETLVSAYPTRNLSEICRVTKGANITLDDEGDLSVIGPSAVRAFFIDPISLDKTSKKKVALAKINPKYAKHHDILIHAIGPHRGETALVTSEFDGLLVSRHMLIVSVDAQEVIPEYMVIALNSSFVRKQVYNISTGSVIAGLTIGNFIDIMIPLPPIEEQQRVVEEVNLIRARMSEFQSRLKDTEVELETLLDSYYTSGGNNG